MLACVQAAYASSARRGFPFLLQTCTELANEATRLPGHVQAVYHMPTSEDADPETSMPLALQSVFYKVRS